MKKRTLPILLGTLILTTTACSGDKATNSETNNQTSLTEAVQTESVTENITETEAVSDTAAQQSEASDYYFTGIPTIKPEFPEIVCPENGTIEEKLDSMGNKEREIIRFANGNICMDVTYDEGTIECIEERDENKNILRRTYGDYSGNVYHIAVWSPDGTELLETFYNEDGSLWFYTHSLLNEYGVQTETVTYNPDGTRQ